MVRKTLRFYCTFNLENKKGVSTDPESNQIKIIKDKKCNLVKMTEGKSKRLRKETVEVRRKLRSVP